MRIGILLPSLFAATLLSTVALADKNDDDNDKPVLRGSAAKERVVRESRSRDAVERSRVTSKDVVKAVKAPAKVAEKRGCSTDDGNGCGSKSSVRTVQSSTATQSKATAPAMPSRLQQRGCATDDGNGCAAKTDGKKDNATKSTTGLVKYTVQTDPRAAALAEEIMRLRREIDAKHILDMLNLKSCARSGTCGDAADM